MIATAETTKTVQEYSACIKATPQAVWDALTQAEWTKRYGYAPLVEYELRAGGKFDVFVSSLGRSLTYDRQPSGHRRAGPEESLMADPKFNELAADIDDASTDVEGLQLDHDAEAGEKLDDLRTTLEHASDMIDEIGDKDEKE